MPQLRGGQAILVSGTTYGNTAVSAVAEVGTGPNVGIFVANAHASIDTTWKVQTSGQASPNAGRNQMTSAADGGATWYDYLVVKSDGTQTALILAVVHGTNLFFDLSPFSPQFLRLVRTDVAGNNNALSAFAIGYGVT